MWIILILINNCFMVIQNNGYSGETGWPSLFGLSSFGLSAKMGQASLAHVFSGQLLTNPAWSDTGCGLKRIKTGQNFKKC